MSKKVIILILIVLLSVPFGGCWNYVSLNEIAIVSGIAIDKDATSNDYLLTFEILDVSRPVKQEGIKAKIVESRGVTLFDAVRNAKKRLNNKLYFGNALITVISRELAGSDEIDDVIDWMLRDAEGRETLYVAISEERTARELIAIEGLDASVVSFEIQRILEEDHSITSSTVDYQLYHIFNLINAKGVSLCLPVFHIVSNDYSPAVEVDGTAVFQGKKMVGKLSPEDSKYLLFATGDVQGGVLAFACLGEGSPDTSLEISKNDTKRSYSYEDEKIKVTIETDTVVYLDEIAHGYDALDEQKIAELEGTASKMVEKNIKRVVESVQRDYGSDIFGFGNMIYKGNPSLWRQISDNWDQLFRTLEVEVHAKVKIVNSAYIKKS